MNKEQVFEAVKSNVEEVLVDIDPGLITIDKSLVDLGANSVDRVEVVTMTMETLDVKIPLISFSHVSNIEDLVDVFVKAL